MIWTHRAPRVRESRAGDGAAQVVIGVAVAAGKVGAGKPENFVHLGRSPTLPQQVRRATHQSTTLQSGWGKRWRICHRSIQA